MSNPMNTITSAGDFKDLRHRAVDPVLEMVADGSLRSNEEIKRYLQDHHPGELDVRCNLF